MTNVFLCSDHHIGHSNIVTFKRSDGVTPLRKFDNIHEHDEYIIYRHNLVVRPNDKVYFLGDVANAKSIHKIGRMHGDKVLIKGNHDVLKLSQYLPYFRDIRGCHQIDGMFLSHIPIHPDSLYRWKVNIHGHLHEKRVMLTNPVSNALISKYPDERYQNVSLEQLDDYAPISLEDMKLRLKNLNLM